MIFESLILAFFIGFLRKGKIKNLEKLYIRGWYFLVAGLIIEIISLLIITRTEWKLADIIEISFPLIHIIIYMFLLVGLTLNIREKGFLISAVGAFLNFLALLFNNGKMPVSPKSLEISKLFTQLTLLKDNRILTHSLINHNTRFSFFCDIIPVVRPFPKIISIGDIFIALGLFIVIQSYMTRKKT